MKKIFNLMGIFAIITFLTSCASTQNTSTGGPQYPDPTKDIKGTWAEILLPPHKVTAEMPNIKGSGQKGKSSQSMTSMTTWYYYLGQSTDFKTGKISYYLMVSQDADKFEKFKAITPQQKILVNAAEIDPLTKAAADLIRNVPDDMKAMVTEMNLYHIYLMFASDIVDRSTSSPAGIPNVEEKKKEPPANVKNEPVEEKKKSKSDLFK